jgi:N-acetylglucosaminyl-diphospho-decaprenol L-rhamnosyltransferase
MPDPFAPVTPGIDLGVVIVSYNTRDLLDTCLSSLADELSAADLRAETLVIDNGSADGSVALVSARHPWAAAVEAGGNLGYAAASNLALRRWLDAGPGHGPRWALILNPDTEARPGALRALVSALTDEPMAAVAGPALVYPDGRFQHAAFRFPGLVQTALDLFPIARLMDSPLNGRYPVNRYRGGRAFVIDFPLGACLLVRMDAVRSVGIMDEGYFMYCEEVDWCRRFRSAGYRALCVPAATVVHHAGASTRQFRGPMFGALWRSRLRYYRRHERWPRRALLVALVRGGLAARAVADRWSARRGRIPDSERADRAAAYRDALREVER